MKTAMQELRDVLYNTSKKYPEDSDLHTVEAIRAIMDWIDTTGMEIETNQIKNAWKHGYINGDLVTPHTKSADEYFKDEYEI